MMKAADVMVTNVIAVGPDACVQNVARILLNSRISAVPVVGSDGKLLGMVSEGDLMRRAEAGTGRKRPWWLEIFTGREVLASEFIKEHSRRIADVMTRNVVTAVSDSPLSAIANLLERNAIKRVPIVEDGKVVGIVSRANLLQALESASDQKQAATPIDDRAGRRGRAVGHRRFRIREESRAGCRRGHARCARGQRQSHHSPGGIRLLTRTTRTSCYLAQQGLQQARRKHYG
jgi:CBS domain-containing protein